MDKYDLEDDHIGDVTSLLEEIEADENEGSIVNEDSTEDVSNDEELNLDNMKMSDLDNLDLDIETEDPNNVMDEEDNVFNEDDINNLDDVKENYNFDDYEELLSTIDAEDNEDGDDDSIEEMHHPGMMRGAHVIDPPSSKVMHYDDQGAPMRPVQGRDKRLPKVLRKELRNFRNVRKSKRQVKEDFDDSDLDNAIDRILNEYDEYGNDEYDYDYGDVDNDYIDEGSEDADASDETFADYLNELFGEDENDPENETMEEDADGYEDVEAYDLDDLEGYIDELLGESESNNDAEEDESENDENEDGKEFLGENPDEDDADNALLGILDELNEDDENEKNINTLLNDEDEEFSDEFRNKAMMIFGAAVSRKAKAKINEVKEKLANKYDEDLAMVLENVVEAVDGYIGRLADAWIDDNTLEIDGKKLKESSNKIIEDLRERNEYLENKIESEIVNNVNLNNTISSNRKDELIAEHKKGLTETDFERFVQLAEDVKLTNETSFKKKLNHIRESYFKQGGAKIQASPKFHITEGEIDENSNDEPEVIGVLQSLDQISTLTDE